MHRVLLVEDLEECQVVVKRALANTSIELTTVSTLKKAFEIIRSTKGFKFDLLILDLGLPDGDGITLLEEVRSREGGQTPVFLLTSHSELDAKVTAFNLGADDYLIKPISGVELRARVEMRLKKSGSFNKSKNQIVKGDLVLNISLLRASIKSGEQEKNIPLTAKEFKILAHLAQNEGTVFTRQDLVKSVWGDVHILERTVDSHIFGLRKKLDAFAGYVECIPNVGYRFITHPQSNPDPKKEDIP